MNTSYANRLMRVKRYAEKHNVAIVICENNTMTEKLMITKDIDTAKAIINQVAEYFSIQPESITERFPGERKKVFLFARYIAMKLIREKTKLSYHLIGAIFGNRNHSSVLMAIDTVNNLIDTDYDGLRRAYLGLNGN